MMDQIIKIKRDAKYFQRIASLLIFWRRYNRCISRTLVCKEYEAQMGPQFCNERRCNQDRCIASWYQQ